MVARRVAVIGAGVAGLTCACELADRGVEVAVYERSDTLGDSACSWFAGGMLAPWCERESAEQAVVDLGLSAAIWWKAHTNQVVENGSLVLSPKRDLRELKRFSRLTEQYTWLAGPEIAELEPDLTDRFEHGLFFSGESHLDPRKALLDLQTTLVNQDVEIRLGQQVNADDLLAQDSQQIVLDCRGFAAKEAIQDLRGVKGEMLILHSDAIKLSRPVRLLHPRYPVYLVPRDDNLFMLGATMIENSERNRITARSMLELLSAVYALHPEFGEADIVETGVDVRPSFRDNLPALSRRGNVLYVNGLYRHGFLLGPAMAMQAANAITQQDVFDRLPLCA